MISLKRYFENGERGAGLETPLRRAIELLLEGICLHIPETEPEEFTGFRKSIRQTAEDLCATDSPEQLLVQVGLVIKSLEDYCKRAAKYSALRNREFQTILDMMTATIRAIAVASEENIRQLQTIEGQLVATTQIEDVRSMKTQLGECLAQIRDETKRQRNTTAATVDDMRACLANPTVYKRAAQGGSQKPEPDLDPVTGLPSRPQAEATFDYLCQAEETWYGMVIVIDSLHSINLRFGHNTGDELLLEYASFIAQLLTAEDRLFRWTGPALLAMLRRSEALPKVRDVFSRLFTERRFEHTARAGSRTILLPVSPRWALFPMMDAPRLFIQKIDSFVLKPAAQ